MKQQLLQTPKQEPDTYEKKCICCGSFNVNYMNCTNMSGHEVYRCKRCEGIFSLGKKNK